MQFKKKKAIPILNACKIEESKKLNPNKEYTLEQNWLISGAIWLKYRVLRIGSRILIWQSLLYEDNKYIIKGQIIF